MSSNAIGWPTKQLLLSEIDFNLGLFLLGFPLLEHQMALHITGGGKTQLLLVLGLCA
jgi:hypothetical protein